MVCSKEDAVTNLEGRRTLLRYWVDGLDEGAERGLENAVRARLLITTPLLQGHDGDAKSVALFRLLYRLL